MCDKEFENFVNKTILEVKKLYVKDITEEQFLDNYELSLKTRNEFLDALQSFSSKNLGGNLAFSFEKMYNELYNALNFIPENEQIHPFDLDLFGLFIEELFICTIAYLLKQEMFQDINNILTYKYKLNPPHYGVGEKICSTYESFRFPSKMLERINRPKDSHNVKFSLKGDLICKKREYIPIFTGSLIANAELFLYQAYKGLRFNDIKVEVPNNIVWFTEFYIYASPKDSIWNKLNSKQFCCKLFPLFNVKSMKELKERISLCTPEYIEEYHLRTGKVPPVPTDYVKLDDIGTLS